MNKWLKGAIQWCPMLFCMLGIFYMSHQPARTLDKFLPWLQRFIPTVNNFNWGHFIAYFFLALAVYWALGTRMKSSKLLTILVCLLYGLSDEFHQMYVPGRTPDWLDIRNDFIGAAIAMLILSIPFIHTHWLAWRRKLERL